MTMREGGGGERGLAPSVSTVRRTLTAWRAILFVNKTTRPLEFSTHYLVTLTSYA